MNLAIVTLATFPLRLVGLDRGRALANAAPDRQRDRREQADRWSAVHGVDAAGIEPAEAPGPRRHSNVGEGRAR
jgi:hypothetical protein